MVALQFGQVLPDKAETNKLLISTFVNIESSHIADTFTGQLIHT
jgi:ribosomal protein S17E